MLSSLSISSNPSGSPRLDYIQSTQNVGKRSCDDHNRIMEPINSNQRSLSDNPSRSSAYATVSTSLPPVTSHMSCHAKCAASRFKPYQLGGHVPTALEHHFTMKNLVKGNEADLSQIDVHQGKEILKKGMKHMTDATVQSAVIAKRADAESKWLHALATAWELESTEKHAVLLQTIMRDNAEQYIASLTEASFFERLLVQRSEQQLEDDADFTVAAYAHDFAAHRIADMQLDHLEEVSAERTLFPEPDDLDSEDVEDRLAQCLNSISKEVEKPMFMVA
ncbi:hypothetical protein DFJ58DRAFT_728070 [Suillus subalutaceus]|uniref:uncharacterized protein n=1 Tax=Suillus subalutaceus TaxID=48586 RepID=UPI001B8704C2|nr:uncharacterized protein DFJ58DRAFT_728070 [Suillus subalutaceus]KAG1853936.1 hypothetical protein DFJ58DRAFT_728070 [Suillus subalutaceus]